MLLRFTLSNTIEGNHTITDPDGWSEIKLKLDRDKEYHSLVEIVELPLIFYRSNNDVDGGYDYITNVISTQGIDAQIGILIEISDDDGDTYENFFQGLLLIETIKDISDAEAYKLECNIARTSLWSKFFSRKSNDVNLNSSVDLDGNAIGAVSESNVYLPSQSIQQTFERQTGYNDSNEGLFTTGQGSGVTTYLMFDNSRYVVDEVKNRFEYGTQVSTNLPTDVSKYLFKALYDGTYRIQSLIKYAVILGASRNYDIRWYYAFRKKGILGASVQIGTTDSGVAVTSFVNSGLGKSLDVTVTLVAGDEIYVYGELILSSTTTITYFPDYDSDPGAPFTPVYTTFEVTANTTYQSTISEGFLLRDAAESILSKVVGRANVLYSDYLGDTGSGCASNYVLMKGLHIRGYSMSDKPMTMSFDDWWNGANPIFNLGLGYETILGTEYIRIEEKGYFYDDTPSLTLDNIDKIVRVYDKDSIFKSIEIGYEKWSAESASGIDDPQTKHTYNTRFKIIGKDEKVLSSFVAASLAIEQTRRNRVDLSKDWRMDDDIMIIALTNDTSPMVAELSADFIVTGLINSDTRYNIRITPGRNFERWKPYFNGCLVFYGGEVYYFASGEGNILMSSTGIGSCDTGSVTENANTAVTSDFYHGAGMYEFEDDLSFEDYKTIRDNRTKALLVSNTTANHKTFIIDSIEYDKFNSLAKFTGWIKE